MAYTAHDPRVFYDAVVTQLASSTGKNIGKAQAPSASAVPYAVVYPLDESDTNTSLADLTDVTIFRWQVSSIGDSLDQVLWMQQKVRAALLGWIPTVAGVSVMPVAREGGFSASRDDDVQPPKYFVGDIFTAFAD
jgi:hypothetical protein